MPEQQIWTVLVFLACIATLPFLVKIWKARQAQGFPGTSEPPPRIISALAVGPQQRLVIVELGRAGARTRMVLGVTAQNITCLSTEPLGAVSSATKTENLEPLQAKV